MDWWATGHEINWPSHLNHRQKHKPITTSPTYSCGSVLLTLTHALWLYLWPHQTVCFLNYYIHSTVQLHNGNNSRIQSNQACYRIMRFYHSYHPPYDLDPPRWRQFSARITIVLLYPLWHYTRTCIVYYRSQVSYLWCTLVTADSGHAFLLLCFETTNGTTATLGGPNRSEVWQHRDVCSCVLSYIHGGKWLQLEGSSRTSSSCGFPEGTFDYTPPWLTM